MENIGTLLFVIAQAMSTFFFELPLTWILLAREFTIRLRSLLLPSQPSPQKIVIVGASSSIGYHLAAQYARRGVKLYLIDEPGKNLDAISQELFTHRGADVIKITPPTFTDFATEARRIWAFPESAPDLFIVTLDKIGYFQEATEMEEEECCRIINYNLSAMFRTLFPVYRLMLERGRGRIIIVASLAGVFGPPNLLVYNCTKAAMLSFARDFRAMAEERGIGVSVAIPGFINTEEMRSVRTGIPPFTWMNPEYAARAIKQGIDQGLPVIVFPLALALPVYVASTLPPIFQNYIARMWYKLRIKGIEKA
ncbi:uncharacterized protein VTP21DRAFT_1635 [Calcarisporiella thermophila]|uniref:uncharacterized protein n=1 Tax=Calcarisporiella thermophila TaxID=911321 RepID=UPI003742921C